MVRSMRRMCRMLNDADAAMSRRVSFTCDDEGAVTTGRGRCTFCHTRQRRRFDGWGGVTIAAGARGVVCGPRGEVASEKAILAIHVLCRRRDGSARVKLE